MLELVEAPLDEISDLVGFEIVMDKPFSSGVAGNDGFGTPLCDQFSYRVGIIGLIGEHAPRPEALEQSRGQGRIATLAGREDYPEGPSASIDGHVDLGRQSSSGASQSLIPPF